MFLFLIELVKMLSLNAYKKILTKDFRYFIYGKLYLFRTTYEELYIKFLSFFSLIEHFFIDISKKN